MVAAAKPSKAKKETPIKPSVQEVVEQSTEAERTPRIHAVRAKYPHFPK